MRHCARGCYGRRVGGVAHRRAARVSPPRRGLWLAGAGAPRPRGWSSRRHTPRRRRGLWMAWWRRHGCRSTFLSCSRCQRLLFAAAAPGGGPATRPTLACSHTTRRNITLSAAESLVRSPFHTFTIPTTATPPSTWSVFTNDHVRRCVPKVSRKNKDALVSTHTLPPLFFGMLLSPTKATEAPLSPPELSQPLTTPPADEASRLLWQQESLLRLRRYLLKKLRAQQQCLLGVFSEASSVDSIHFTLAQLHFTIRQLGADVQKVDVALARLTGANNAMLLVGEKPTAIPNVFGVDGAPQLLPTSGAHTRDIASSPPSTAACGSGVATQAVKAANPNQPEDDPARTRSGTRPEKRLGWAPLERELPTPRVLDMPSTPQPVAPETPSTREGPAARTTTAAARESAAATNRMAVTPARAASSSWPPSAGLDRLMAKIGVSERLVEEIELDLADAEETTAPLPQLPAELLTAPGEPARSSVATPPSACRSGDLSHTSGWAASAPSGSPELRRDVRPASLAWPVEVLAPEPWTPPVPPSQGCDEMDCAAATPGIAAAAAPPTPPPRASRCGTGAVASREPISVGVAAIDELPAPVAPPRASREVSPTSSTACGAVGDAEADGASDAGARRTDEHPLATVGKRPKEEEGAQLEGWGIAPLPPRVHQLLGFSPIPIPQCTPSPSCPASPQTDAGERSAPDYVWFASPRAEAAHGTPETADVSRGAVHGGDSLAGASAVAAPPSNAAGAALTVGTAAPASAANARVSNAAPSGRITAPGARRGPLGEVPVSSKPEGARPRRLFCRDDSACSGGSAPEAPLEGTAPPAKPLRERRPPRASSAAASTAASAARAAATRAANASRGANPSPAARVVRHPSSHPAPKTAAPPPAPQKLPSSPKGLGSSATATSPKIALPPNLAMLGRRPPNHVGLDRSIEFAAVHLRASGD